MKFSLREVFNIHSSDSPDQGETSRLLEMYEILNVSSPASNTRVDSDETLEGIQRAVNQMLEGVNNSVTSNDSTNPSPKKVVNRDDLVLDRWRKMAGL